MRGENTSTQNAMPNAVKLNAAVTATAPKIVGQRAGRQRPYRHAQRAAPA